MLASTADVKTYVSATWYLPRLATGTDASPTNVPTPNDITRLQAGDTIYSFGIDASSAALTDCGDAVLTGASALIACSLVVSLVVLY